VFIGLQAGFVGYLLARLNVFERILMFIAALVLMAHINTKSMLWLVVGMGMIAVSFGIQIGKRRNRRN
jgi:TRAP-type uncharacterized transport system fused permease subunit